MAAEPSAGRRAHGPVRFVPGPAGIAVLLVTVILVVWVAPERRIAVGFLIPIVGAAIADGVLGARTVKGRQVRISTVRSVVAAPEVVTLQVISDPDPRPTRLIIDPMQRDEPVVSVALPADGSVVTVAWAPGIPYVAFYARHLIESTRFGLVVARRVTITELPAGAWRIGPPAPLRIDEPPAGEDLTRLREYVPGDRMSRVSWPTTAHTGRLHVRADDVDPAEVVVVVDCGSDEAEAETALRFAAGVIGRLLDGGTTVRLTTRVHDGFYREIADRMLAAPARSPVTVYEEWWSTAGGAGTVVDDWVTTRDEMIRRLAVAEFGAPLPSPAGPHIRVDASGARLVA